MTNCLLADIGGTHARFAVLSGTKLNPIHSVDVGSYATPEAAIRHFLNFHAQGVPVDSGVIAAAGPVEGGRCALTNAPWVLSTDELKQSFGLSALNIVNDLEALAWATRHLAPEDGVKIGRGHEVAGQPVAIVAPGTGLGMACLVPGGDGGRVLASEGGHATLPASNAEEAALIEIFRKRHGHVSCERILSGQGLVDLYAALAELDGVAVEHRRGEQITQAAVDGTCAHSRRTLDMFCALLGAVAGDAALTFGARGGVYIGGGIVPGLADYLRRTSFRTRFEDKGRLRRYLAHVPTTVIVRPDPAFLGLKALAEAAPEQRTP